MRILEILARPAALKAKHAAIRKANAALLLATLQRGFIHTERAHA
jgi:hypothetical protein